MRKKFICTLCMMLGLFLHLNVQFAEAKGIHSFAGIDVEKAKQIALEQINGKIISVQTEEDDGTIKYEIIVQTKNGKYEVEIDKATGKVLEVEKERSDDDHDDDDDDDRYDD